MHNLKDLNLLGSLDRSYRSTISSILVGGPLKWNCRARMSWSTSCDSLCYGVVYRWWLLLLQHCWWWIVVYWGLTHGTDSAGSQELHYNIRLRIVVGWRLRRLLVKLLKLLGWSLDRAFQRKLLEKIPPGPGWPQCRG